MMTVIMMMAVIMTIVNDDRDGDNRDDCDVNNTF